MDEMEIYNSYHDLINGYSLEYVSLTKIHHKLSRDFKDGLLLLPDEKELIKGIIQTATDRWERLVPRIEEYRENIKGE